ncbi:transmembrane protein 208 isoform X2 [Achroia grisella]|nr:transmembrane protein 208 isoform X2 [Achroia grisella]
MAMAATGVYCILTPTFYSDNLSSSIIFINVLVMCGYIACYRMMKYISRPHYTADNQLIDPGLDLNMEGGIGEHIKDIVILLSLTHILAIVTNYFWCLLLALPLRAGWLLWTNILGPWFFQPAPEETEQDEKKKKKKMKRM